MRQDVAVDHPQAWIVDKAAAHAEEARHRYGGCAAGLLGLILLAAWAAYGSAINCLAAST